MKNPVSLLKCFKSYIVYILSSSLHLLCWHIAAYCCQLLLSETACNHWQECALCQPHACQRAQYKQKALAVVKSSTWYPEVSAAGDVLHHEGVLPLFHVAANEYFSARILLPIAEWLDCRVAHRWSRFKSKVLLGKEWEGEESDVLPKQGVWKNLCCLNRLAKMITMAHLPSDSSGKYKMQN